MVQTANVAADLRFGIEERTTSAGEILTLPSPADLKSLASQVAAKRPEAIAISARSLLPEHPELSVRGVVGDFAHDLPRIALVAPPASPVLRLTLR